MNGLSYYGSKLSPNMTETPEGFLICLNVPIGRIGDMKYTASEIGISTDSSSIITVTRDEADVKDRTAGSGKTPIQSVIPVELADEFLSEDGTYWSAWSEMKESYPDIPNNTFFISQKFNLSNASIVMRVPYTYDYELEYMKKLEARKFLA